MKDLFLSLLFAFSFLTRIPIQSLKRLEYTEHSISNSPLFFPLVGLFYGVIQYYAIVLVRLMECMVEIQALVILSVPFIMNRFLHFDGLCDVADAFFADVTSSRRLEILKDSRIGSFALGIVIIYMLLKFSILKFFLSGNTPVVLIIMIYVLSRYSMALLSSISRYARESGTGSLIVGRVPALIFAAASAMTIIIGGGVIVLSGVTVFKALYMMIILFTIMVFYSMIFRYWSYKKINGITGDVLGAVCETMETALLIALIKVWGALL